MHDTPIPGLRLIKHKASGIDLPDDLSYRYCLAVVLRLPEFKPFAGIAIFDGTEQIVLLGSALDAVHEFMDRNQIKDHPSLARYHIVDRATNSIIEKKNTVPKEFLAL